MRVQVRFREALSLPAPVATEVRARAGNGPANGKGNLGSLGLTELFFESNEPSFDEQSLEGFLEPFPEGTGFFSGRTVDGERLDGSAVFTHAIPAGPVLVSPAEGPVQDPAHVVVDGDPVTGPPGVRCSRERALERGAPALLDRAESGRRRAPGGEPEVGGGLTAA